MAVLQFIKIIRFNLDQINQTFHISSESPTEIFKYIDNIESSSFRLDII